MEDKKLKETDFEEAAKLLGLDIATIKAVAKIESSGSGFTKSGKPTILFEGHVFWKELKKVGIDPQETLSKDKSLTDILYSKWTKVYYKSGDAEHERLERAKKINESAALKSASFGMFQIMGFNYSVCGYKDVNSFVKDMEKSEKEHLLAFCNFLKSNNLIQKLKNKDWAGFAKSYNGPGFSANAYDKKLAVAYESFKK